MFLFLFQICCCSDSKQAKNRIASLNMNDASEINFDNLVEDVNCTIIESLPNAYMVDCWKIIKHEDFFYLYSLSDFAVCIFEKDGRFIKRIDGEGKGKIETPCDIYIDNTQEQLWIVESRHFINKYTLQGDFITRVELPFYAVKITQTDNKSFLFYDGGFDRESGFFVRQTSTNYITKKTFVEKKNQQHRSIPVSLFTNDYSNKTAYSLLPHIDTIYISNKNKTFIPYFHLNFNNNLLTFEVFPKNGFNDKEKAAIINQKKLIHDIRGFNYASGLLFMQLYGKDNSFRAVDLNTKAVYKFNSLIDGISIRSDATTIQGSTDSELLVSIPAKDFFNEYKRKNNQTRYESVKKILDNSKDVTNRIVLAIKIKKQS